MNLKIFWKKNKFPISSQSKRYKNSSVNVAKENFVSLLIQSDQIPSWIWHKEGAAISILHAVIRNDGCDNVRTLFALEILRKRGTNCGWPKCRLHSWAKRGGGNQARLRLHPRNIVISLTVANFLIGNMARYGPFLATFSLQSVGNGGAAR